MHLFRSVKIRHAIAFGIGAAVGTIYFLSVIAAHAARITGVSIAGNGQTIVNGAIVMHVRKAEITAVSRWGATRIQWRIIPTGSTRFTPQRNDQALTEFVHLGEVIGFSGTLDQKMAAPTLYASMIRNETVVQRSVVLDGNVINTDSAGVLVVTDTGTSTVRISTGTILTRDGNRASIADLQPGEQVKAFGTFNARERVLDAARVVSASLPHIPNTGEPEKRNVLGSILAWFRDAARH